MIPIAEAAATSGHSVRRLQVLCKQGRIPGARLLGGRLWLLPVNWNITPAQRGPKLR